MPRSRSFIETRLFRRESLAAARGSIRHARELSLGLARLELAVPVAEDLTDFPVQRITTDHTLVAEDLTDFPVLITYAVVQVSLFAHARSDGADIVVTAGGETTRLKRELVTYDALAGEFALYVRIPSLSSIADTRVYIYYGNAGAAEANDADTWNADYGVVYHLREDPAGTAPQAKDSTANAVHGTYDVAGATVEDNTLWGGKCILFDNGPRLRVDDDPAIENADRITIEAWSTR